KDVDGKERPMWRTRWWVPDGRHSDQPHPPLLLVFNRIGPRNPDTVIAQLAELTQRHWKGTWYEDCFHMYDGKLPIVVTSMKHLKEHGPAGAVFRRFGRPHHQTLLEAIGNPRREAHDARKQTEYTARHREHQEQLRRIAAQHKAGREANRPVCADCGTRFTDERWKPRSAVRPQGHQMSRQKDAAVSVDSYGCSVAAGRLCHACPQAPLQYVSRRRASATANTETRTRNALTCSAEGRPANP
ncbi:hypothetical protein RM812_39000, partial [Streptomyces sp. DSM 40712]|nr:hypothetical protein [Streptomyces sp. DSM 40712]